MGAAAALAGVVVCFLLAAGCGSSPSPGPSATTSVAARVNGEPVGRDEVDRMVALSKLGSKPLTDDQALEAVVRRHLLQREAARLGVTVKDAAVEQRLADVASGAGGTDALQQSLSGVGVTLDDYRTELRAALLAETLAARKFPGTAATTADARAYFAGHRAQFAVPAAVRLQEIVTKTKGQAVQALRRLRKGDTFSAVARVLSADPQAREAGGDLGWVLVASLPQGLTGPIRQAAVGTVVGPLQALGGWHIDRVLGRRAARERSFAEVRSALVHDLTVKARTAALSRWLAHERAAADVVKGS
jgi:peptidyl-prolyl cis-trans isomerase C